MNTFLILLSAVSLSVAIYQYIRRTNAEETLEIERKNANVAKTNLADLTSKVAKTMYIRNAKGQMQKA